MRTIAFGTEVSLGTSVAGVATNLASEVQRATSVDGSLSVSINVAVSAEAQRAQQVEGSLGVSVIREVSRAAGVELSLAVSMLAEALRAPLAEASLSLSLASVRTAELATEASLATSVAGVATNLASDTSRAISVDRSLAVSMNAAVSAATQLSQQAEGSLAVSVSREASRAVSVEGSIATVVSSIGDTVNTLSGAGYGRFPSSPGQSCLDIYYSNPNARGISGQYYLTGGTVVYCEMTMLYGSPGWTLVAMMSDVNANDATWGYSSTLWTTTTTVINPNVTDITLNVNMKNGAFNTLPLTNIRFVYGLPSSSNTGFGVATTAANTATLFTGPTVTTSFTRPQFDAALQNVYGSSAVSTMAGVRILSPLFIE